MLCLRKLVNLTNFIKSLISSFNKHFVESYIALISFFFLYIFYTKISSSQYILIVFNKNKIFQIKMNGIYFGVIKNTLFKIKITFLVIIY